MSMGSHRVPSTHIAWFMVAWFFRPDGVLAILHCQVARQMCVDDDACALLLDVIYKTCGDDTYDGTVCRSSNLESCQGALTSVWGNAPFHKRCVCSDDEKDAECRHLRSSLSAHPCLKIPRINPADRVETEDYPTCTYAYNLCYHNIKCKKIFDYFRRMCRVKDSQCAMRDRAKCQRAWTKIQLTPVIGCLCHEDTDIEKCAKIYALVNSNPCVQPDPPPELYTASLTRAEEVTALVTDVDGTIPFPGFEYDTNESSEEHNFNPVVSALHGELVGLHSSHVHPNVIGATVDEPHIPALPPDVFPSTAIKAKSTCPKAHEVCVEDLTCRVLLDNMLQVCDTMRAPCNRTECMAAIRNFYDLGNPDIMRSVAFCICRYNDLACLIQQRQLHPPCAQRPEVELPGCHQVAAQCQSNPDCRWRMDRFISACAVDQTTIQCRGPLEQCRIALINILGTPLRTNCACSGNDFSLLYSCIDWQRLIWLNPCVVQAQKEYHEMKMTTPPPLPTKQSQKPAAKNAGHLYSTAGTKHTATTNGPHPTPMHWISTMKPTPPDTETCAMTSGGENTVYIKEGQSQRVYEADNPDCSMLCWCNVGGYTTCHHLVCAEKKACRSPQAVYSHSFETYRAFRGYCICFSGNFICAKPTDGYDLGPGVYLFLGYSKLEEASVKNFTNMTISNSVHDLQKLLESQEKACRMLISQQIGDNVIIQVYLNDYDAERKNNNITPEMVLREEEACAGPLQNITRMINRRDPAVHNHVAMSILKQATVDVHAHKFQGAKAVAEPLSGSLFVITILVQLLLHRPP